MLSDFKCSSGHGSRYSLSWKTYKVVERCYLFPNRYANDTTMLDIHLDA